MGTNTQPGARQTIDRVVVGRSARFVEVGVSLACAALALLVIDTGTSEGVGLIASWVAAVNALIFGARAVIVLVGRWRSGAGLQEYVLDDAGLHPNYPQDRAVIEWKGIVEVGEPQNPYGLSRASWRPFELRLADGATFEVRHRPHGWSWEKLAEAMEHSATAGRLVVVSTR